MSRIRTVVALTVATIVASLFVGVGPAHAATIRSVTWPSTWSSPLGGTSVSVSTNYGAYDRGCPNADTSNGYTYYLESGRTEHLGVDLSSADGNNVYSIGAGTVKAAGTIWGAGSKEVLVIEHSAGGGDKFIAAYGHITIAANSATGAKWKTGDSVTNGAKVGTISTAGTGPHLHFGIETGTGTYVDPTAENSGTGNCIHQDQGTVDPLPFLNAHPATGGGGGATSADKTDVDHNGCTDLVLTSNEGTGSAMWSLLSTCQGFLSPARWLNGTGFLWGGITPLVGDVNGDAKADYVFLTNEAPNGTKAFVALSTGSGFSAPQLWWTGTGMAYTGLKASLS